MPIVRLGNVASLDRDAAGHQLVGNRVTTVRIMDEDDLDTRVRTVTHSDGLWARLSSEPPAWVESTDSELETALAEHFACEVGEPENWA